MPGFYKSGLTEATNRVLVKVWFTENSHGSADPPAGRFPGT